MILKFLYAIIKMDEYMRDNEYMRGLDDDYDLAWNYYNGTGGVCKDVKEAYKIWERLAHQEHGPSMYVINTSI